MKNKILDKENNQNEREDIYIYIHTYIFSYICEFKVELFLKK
jgi:hypothetical protein